MPKPVPVQKPRHALTVARIKTAFGGAWPRGEAYWKQGRVRIKRYDNDSVQAEVDGRAPRPYQTTVKWEDISGWSLHGKCTCPIGGYCKHSVAVALAWLDALERAKSTGHASAPASSGATVTTDIDRAQSKVTAQRRKVDAKPAVAAAPPPPPALQPPPPSARFTENMLEPSPFARFDGAASLAAHSASRPLPAKPRAEESVRWLFWWGPGGDQLLVCPVISTRLKSGRWGAARALDLSEEARLKGLRSVPARQLPWIFALSAQLGVWHESRWYRAIVDNADAVISGIIDDGHAAWLEPNGHALRLGKPDTMRLFWEIDAAGQQRLYATVDGGARVVGASWSWYVDPENGVIGRVETDIPVAQRRILAGLGPIAAEHSARARVELAARMPDVTLPVPRALTVDARPTEAPRGVLTLVSPSPDPDLRSGVLMHGCEAVVAFAYEGARIAARDAATLVRRLDGDRVRIIPRDFVYEQHVGRFLAIEGFRHPFGAWPDRERTFPQWRSFTTFPDHSALRAWFDGFVARAAAQRIDVETGSNFPIQLGADLGVTEVDLVESESGWFEARLGLIVDDQRIDLLPLLVAAASDPERLKREGLTVMLPEGRRAWLSPERLAPMIALLEEGEFDDGRLQLERPKLAAFDPPPDWRFTPDRRLAAFLDELRGFDRLVPVQAPKDFGADLRSYQQFGLAWLDFLRRYGFGGVLADDMGLGKTVQCLAHVARERAAGRLQSPVLVVCPTSVVPNWLAEAERFVPGLRVLALERGDRAEALAALAKHDLVITSYALLPRDAEALTAMDWQMLVLDEAQWLKNKATKAWHAVARLRARMRLAMTGTPVENHLGELKAQLDLVMPGLLGDDRRYAERYRGPIERARDAAAEAALRQRIRPFLLRRRKDDVAIDLPPRTTLVRKIAFDEAQQDLYETLRARMEKRVRDALKKQGLARSHITVLDALLKLRQVCCDPSLVDMPAARKVQASAKRAVLMEMLPTLVDEGRRVLVFSQFTSMLDLIEADLSTAGIGHVRLDGSTRDRATPVKRFQAGAVPVFLISLKAGGVGLNLTRADTVILYDPWWNPAVESQAIDRAHRIGQDKPVFVHELQCIGTVEEKMATLKARKRALADAVLAEGEAAVSRLDADSLLALFAPVGV